MKHGGELYLKTKKIHYFPICISQFTEAAILQVKLAAYAEFIYLFACWKLGSSAAASLSKVQKTKYLIPLFAASRFQQMLCLECFGDKKQEGVVIAGERYQSTM